MFFGQPVEFAERPCHGPLPLGANAISRENSLERCALFGRKDMLNAIGNGLLKQSLLPLHGSYRLVRRHRTQILGNARLTDDLLSRFREHLEKLPGLILAQIDTLPTHVVNENPVRNGCSVLVERAEPAIP
jgi:hypothetical protein